MQKTAQAATALALAIVATSTLAQEAIGILKRSRGDVAVERAGVRVSAMKGMELRRGDRLVTAKGGYAYVELRGTAPLAVGPETQILLDRYAVDEKRLADRSAPRLLQSLASYFALNRHR